MQSTIHTRIQHFKVTPKQGRQASKLPSVIQAHNSPFIKPSCLIQRKANCVCGGGCPNCQAEKEENEVLPIQAKLRIGATNDKYEQEADRVAEQVMRMPEPSAQRQVGEEEEGFLQAKPLLQRRAADNSSGGEVSPIVNEVLRSPGWPLDTNTRSFMESRFGHDFSHVRVHTDARAVRSAQAMNALAYTVGQEIIFGTGQYKPSTAIGKRLLAHELVHVIQQNYSMNAPRIQKRRIHREYSTAILETGPIWDITLIIRGAPEESTEHLQDFVLACENGIRSAARYLRTHSNRQIQVNMRYRRTSQFSDISQEAYNLALQSVLGSEEEAPTTPESTLPESVEETLNTPESTLSESETLPSIEQPSSQLREPVCGPDITEELIGVLRSIRSWYNDLTPDQQENACNSIHSFSDSNFSFVDAWDISELFYFDWLASPPYYPFCGSSPNSFQECLGTVEVLGQCYLAGTVNYAMLGVMASLCDWIMPEWVLRGLIYAWKGLNTSLGGFDDPIPPTEWAIAAYRGFPSFHPTQGNRPHCRTTCPVEYRGPSFDWIWEPYKPRRN